MNMAKLIKYALSILALSALLIGLGQPVLATYSGKILDDQSKITRSGKRGGDDPPWDPGDEFEPPKIPFVNVYFPKEDTNKQVLIQFDDIKLAEGRKGNDQPWDPGDESIGTVEVHDA